MLDKITIETHSLTKIYKTGKVEFRALNNVSLKIKKGDFIALMGPSGSGKTTVAARIAKALDLLHIELDSIHWLPNWTELPDDEFRAQVAEKITLDRWVADGNYKVVRDILWRRADTLVWLDLPRPAVH